MRRKDKEIIDQDEIQAIIDRSLVCRLAMVDGDTPYIVPLCFGYDSDTLYFHSANTGRKLDILRRNPKVCFEFEVNCRVKPGENACKWGMSFKSVIGFGKVTYIESSTAKRGALDTIIRQYGGDAGDYTEAKLKSTVVFAVDIESMSGKASPAE